MTYVLTLNDKQRALLQTLLQEELSHTISLGMMHPTVDYFQFHVSDVADLRDTVRALKGQDDVLV